MHKAENGHVYPIEVLLVKESLHELGFSETDQEWLVRVIKRPDCLGDASGTSFNREIFEYFLYDKNPQWIVEELGGPIQTEKDRQTCLALLFSFLLDLFPHNKHEGSEQFSDSSEWIGEFQRHAAFSAKYLDFYKLYRVRNPVLIFGELISFLFPEGVPLNQVVDLGLLSPIPPLLRSNRTNRYYDNPKHLEFWLIGRFCGWGDSLRFWPRIEKLDTLLPIFEKFSDDILGDKVFGLLHAVEEGFLFYPNPTLSEQGLNPINTAWKLVAPELIPFFKLLDAKTPEKGRERTYLLQAWWYLSRIIYDSKMGGLKDELSQEIQNRLVESAVRHIGILRSILRDNPKDFDKENWHGIPVFDFYVEVFDVLLAFAKPWKRLKPLLLAFSQMKHPAVTSDLRAWPEFGREPIPDPYARVAMWIAIGMYPEHLQDELERDPHLQELREEFAKFCLGRLKTEKGTNKKSNFNNEDFVEPRSVWRQCYVQALAALRVNPGGRAHRTLFWLLNNDPDDTVRELAKKAHKRVRHLDRSKPNLDEGASPRRPLFEAWWWLRQAHLITLDKDIDRAGAMRTRRVELHRTREKDDVFKRR